MSVVEHIVVVDAGQFSEGHFSHVRSAVRCDSSSRLATCQIWQVQQVDGGSGVRVGYEVRDV
jgi:hypothetical protein